MNKPPPRIVISVRGHDDERPGAHTYSVVEKTILHHHEIVPGFVFVGTYEEISERLANALWQARLEHEAALKDIEDESIRELRLQNRRLA